MLTSAVILFLRLRDSQRRVYCPGGRKCAEKTGSDLFSRKSTTERETRGSIKVVEIDPPPEIVKIILIVLEKKTGHHLSEKKKTNR